MISGTALRWPVSIAAVVVIIVGGIAAVACAPATPPPPTATPIPPPPAPPSNLDLTVEPGTTKVSATWDEVAGAAAYEVRWRSRREDFPTWNLATVMGPTATFDVREQGLWLIRVQACNDSGCGGPGTATVPVIINISGHEAVRLWFDFDPEADSDEISAVHLDWDALPGYYIVKYRLTNNNNWITSEPLSEPGYTFTADSFATFEKRGQPIVRVFFNCDKDGRSCALLGRSPNTTMEKIWTRIPVDPYAAGGDGVSGASAAGRSYLTAGQEADPLTHMLRPASDFTVTTEIRDGITYRCVSRPAENPWEKGVFGAGNDAIKSCAGGRTINEYLFNPDAVFPDGAVCVERPAETDLERRIYGDTVKVCKEHPTLEGSSRRAAPDGGVSGQSHSV